MACISRRQFSRTIAATLAAAPLRAAGPKPRVCVWLIAEQFRADYLDRFAPYFGDGGFRKLVDDGAYFPLCRMEASTYSSSAIATLGTGTWPDAHGVVADRWYDPDAKRLVSAADTAPSGSTLPEEVAADPRNRVAVTALDRRFARALTGRGGERVPYYDLDGPATGEPAWLTKFRGLYPTERFRDVPWRPLRASADAPPLRVLAYEAARPEDFLSLYRSSPFAQQTQFEMLRVMAAEMAPDPGGTVFLVGVLESLGWLGYETGAESPLMRDLVLQLDQQIEITLDALNKSAGPGNFALVFSGAHGVPAEPPVADRKALAVAGEELALRVDRALSAAFDGPKEKNRWVDRYVYPFLYLRQELARRLNLRPADVRRVAGEAALRVPGVAAWYAADGESSRGGLWQERARNSFHALRSGDVMLAYEPGCIEETVAGRGISYGSLYNYDALTPLILYGAPFRTRTFDAEVRSIDVAPTLARVLQAAPPAASVGRVLAEALADSKK